MRTDTNDTDLRSCGSLRSCPCVQSSVRNYVCRSVGECAATGPKVSESSEENYPVGHITRTFTNTCYYAGMVEFSLGGLWWWLWLIILALVEQIVKCAHISEMECVYMHINVPNSVIQCGNSSCGALYCVSLHLLMSVVRINLIGWVGIS